MAFRTRSAVRALTLSEPFIVRDTVAVETLACFATSLMFIGNCILAVKSAGNARAAIPGDWEVSYPGSPGPTKSERDSEPVLRFRCRRVDSSETGAGSAAVENYPRSNFPQVFVRGPNPPAENCLRAGGDLFRPAIPNGGCILAKDTRVIPRGCVGRSSLRIQPPRTTCRTSTPP